MGLMRASKLTPPLSPRAAEYLMYAAALTGVLVAAVLCAYGSYTRAASVIAVSLAAGALVSSRVSLDWLVLIWFAATPAASYFLRFPEEKTIISFDRAVFAVALLLLISVRKGKSFYISKFEITWSLLSVIALLSAMVKSDNPGYALRIAVDSFWLPLIAFHLARYHLTIGREARALILATIALAVFLFLAGAYEMRTGVDLFQYPGSQIVREGERRVNGPFISDSSYANICLMLGVFLWLAPAIFRVRFDRSGRLVHLLAVGAVIVASLLPLFRAVALALLVCMGFVLSFAMRKGRVARQEGRVQESAGGALFLSSTGLAAIVISLVLILAAFAMVAMTSGGQRLLDPYNLIGRLPTWESAANIAMENPVSGVGLANYRDYFHEKYFTGVEMQESVLQVRAADTPHSNPLWIASELGVVAFVLYLVANVYIFRTGYSSVKHAVAPDRRAAALCYLALVTAYWIPGLTLSSGVYSDLNLYFFFLIGLLSNRFSAKESNQQD
jgi:hypothetical protein